MEPRILHYSHCRKISLKLPKSPCLSLRRVLQTYILEKLALFIEMQKKNYHLCLQRLVPLWTLHLHAFLVTVRPVTT